jgi:hypothetical protein
MNEKLPESGNEQSPLTPVQDRHQNKPLSKKACAGLGVLIFFVSIALSFISPLLCLLGFVGAIVTLFFPGYRLIFVGYILTLGVLLLGTIIYCANSTWEIR